MRRRDISARPTPSRSRGRERPKLTLNQPLPDPPRLGRRRVRPQAEFEELILAELFSVERLEQHAQTLAVAQVVTDAPRPGHAVAPRTAENRRELLETHRVPALAIKDERSFPPAAVWLLD